MIDINYIENYEKLFLINYQGERKEIKLREGRIIYQNEELDSTIIEIKQNDNFNASFLEMYEHSDIGKIQDKEIYILHYPKGEQNLKYSQGKMMKNKIKNGLTFEAKYGSKEGSSGAPVIYSEQKLVIGIHLGYFLIDNKKIVVIIKDVVNIFLE